MSSVGSSHKQIAANSGYFITLADCRAKIYQNDGSDAAPAFSINAAIASNAPFSNVIAAAGTGIFKDHGKTLISSGRVFRKVQLLVSSPTTSGVAGADVAPTNQLTGYIELPGQGVGSGAGGANYAAGAPFTPVARLG